MIAPLWKLFVVYDEFKFGCGSEKEKERHDNASSPLKAQEPKEEKVAVLGEERK